MCWTAAHTEGHFLLSDAEAATHPVNEVQVTVGVYEQPHNLSVAVEHSEVERCGVLLCSTQRRRACSLVTENSIKYHITVTPVVLYIVLVIKGAILGKYHFFNFFVLPSGPQNLKEREVTKKNL